MSDTPDPLTRLDALYALDEVKKFLLPHISQSCAPALIRGWDYPDSGSRAWAIVWEEGPDDWAITVSHADIMDPARVHAEPYNGWALCLYRP